jgi:hypothetical protein
MRRFVRDVGVAAAGSGCDGCAGQHRRASLRHRSLKPFHIGRCSVCAAREPVSDIDTEVVGSLKVLDPRRPIREEKRTFPNRRFVPQAVMPLPPRRGGTFVRLIPKKGPSPETLPSGE